MLHTKCVRNSTHQACHTSLVEFNCNINAIECNYNPKKIQRTDRFEVKNLLGPGTMTCKALKYEFTEM